MKLTILITVLLFFLNGCSSFDQGQPVSDTSLNRKIEEKPIDNRSYQETDTVAYDVAFYLNKENVHQTLKVKFKSDKILAFHLVVKKEKNTSVKGEAVLIDPAFDGETIESEDGYMIFVDEYRYDMDSCDLILRIDSEEKKYASVLLRNCKKEETNPFLTGVMARVK